MSRLLHHLIKWWCPLSGVSVLLVELVLFAGQTIVESSVGICDPPVQR
jgi:hypothetical protein